MQDQILCVDALHGLKQINDSSVNLVVTSPPYADVRKSYQHISPDNYVSWFLPIAEEIQRVLTNDGSFLLNINDRIVRGERSIFVIELVYRIASEVGLKFIDKLCWVKKNGLPTSGPKRRSDYWEPIWHFAKSTQPKFYIDEIREPYAATSVKRAKKPIKANASNRETRESTGDKSYRKWNLNPKGAHPKNVLYFPKDTGKNHVAAFHIELPKHFIRAHTDLGDLVVDPFCGRGTTCAAAQELGRHYLGFDTQKSYLTLGRDLYGLNLAD